MKSRTKAGFALNSAFSVKQPDEVKTMKLMRVVLPLCALILLAGCDRSTEGTQEVKTEQVTHSEVAVEIEAAEQTEDVVETPEAETQAVAEPESVTGLAQQTAIEDLPPLAPLPWLTDPLPESGTPELVHFETDAGDFVIAVYPDAAPNAAERFLHLVEVGYYDGIPISRVVPGFVAQFGINWREDYRDWKEENFDDDPTRFAFLPGTLAFAKAGPNTNSTQVFINYGNNNRLANPQYNFSVFAQVIEGMNVVESFRSVGDPSGGLNQSLLWDGGQAYLDYLDEKPNMILDASRIQ